MTAREEAAALREVLAGQVTASTDALARLARLEALLVEAPPVDTPVDPPPVDPPVGPLRARVGTATYPIAAVDPVRGPERVHPGGREADELVYYTRPGKTGTNQHGAEVTLAGGLAGGVAGPVVVGATGGLAVVEGVPVLSGHGRAAAWLRSNVRPGVRVDIEQAVPAPGGGGGVPAPPPSGMRTVAIYRKDGSSSTARIPAGINRFLYAFLQQGGLVEWGGESIATQAANLGRWLDGGGRDLAVSVGGSKGSVSTSDRAGFVAKFRAAERALGSRVSVCDWDLEASALVVDDVDWISRTLAEGRKDTFVISFAPPGGDPVAPALEAAVRLHRAGYRVQVGQQLYEGDKYIDEAAAMGALRRAVNAGLPPSCVLLGTMVGGDARHWTIDMCVRVAEAALDQWPDFGGTYLWSEGQEQQDAEWARRMAALFNPS